MTHHHPHRRHGAAGKISRGYGFATVAGVLILFLALAAGALWISLSQSATQREDEARAVVRSKNLADLQASDQATLTTYGWNDRAKGIVRVPIARAMELVIPELNARAPKPASTQP